MYTSFREQNFRGFRNLQLNDLGRVNLIAGKNNAGKTALLEAMHIHSGNREPKTLLRIKSFLRDDDFPWRTRRYVSYIEPASIVSWNDLFNDFGIVKEIEMSAKFAERPKQLPNDQSCLSLKISTISPDSEDFIKILREYEVEGDDRYDNVEILEFESNVGNKPFYILLSNEMIRASSFKSNVLIPSNFLYTREAIGSRIIAQLYSKMKKSGTIEGFIDALKIIEPKLVDLDLLYSGNRPLIYVDIGLRQLLPITSLGDGMNRIAGLLLAMSEVANGVLFIDEIENGFHYSIQKDVWKVIGQLAHESNIQVFATTHSLEMIRAAHEAFKDDDPYDFRYHRLDRDSFTGAIEAVTYNQFGMEAVAAFDFDYEVRG